MTADFLDTYAIRTGRTWTAVRVGRGQCTVARADGNGRIVYQGQDQRTIKRAANDGGARSYKTLRELTETEPSAIRRSDLDL